MMSQRITIQLTESSSHVACFKKRRRTWARTSLQEYPVGYPSLPREASDLAPFGTELGSLLRQGFPAGMTGRLVIPASWCFIHRVEPVSDRWSDEAAIFEFEQYVPLNLERLTCAVRRLSKGGAVVVGVCTEALSALLQELEIPLAQLRHVLEHRLGQARPNWTNRNRQDRLRTETTYCPVFQIQRGFDLS